MKQLVLNDVPARITTFIFDLDDTLVPQDPSDQAAILIVARAVLDKVAAADPAPAGPVLADSASRDPAPSHTEDAATTDSASRLAAAVHRCAKRLWDEHALGAFCRSVGIGYTEGMHAQFASLADPYPQLRAWSHEYRRKVWVEALGAVGIGSIETGDVGRGAGQTAAVGKRAGARTTTDAELSALADFAAERFIAEREKRRAPFPETLAVLQALRGRFRLGMLTNGAPDLQREKVERAGIGPLFDAVVISGDHGIGKPDPRIFDITLAELGSTPAETAMVGNSITSDMHGARAAGLYAVWVNRGDEPTAAVLVDAPPDASRPFDLEVASLDALPWVVDGRS